MPTKKLYRQSRSGLESGVLVVDDADADLLDRKWRLHPEGYACIGRGREGDPTLYIHRLITVRFHGEIPSGPVIDHVNHNRLDNRRSNLRVVSNEENLRRNRRPADFKTCAGCKVRSRKVCECVLCLIPYCPVCTADHSC